VCRCGGICGTTSELAALPFPSSPAGSGWAHNSARVVPWAAAARALSAYPSRKLLPHLAPSPAAPPPPSGSTSSAGAWLRAPQPALGTDTPVRLASGGGSGRSELLIGRRISSGAFALVYIGRYRGQVRRLGRAGVRREQGGGFSSALVTCSRPSWALASPCRGGVQSARRPAAFSPPAAGRHAGPASGPLVSTYLPQTHAPPP